MHYFKLSDTEVDKLLKENFQIIYDTREQQNQHVLAYFDKVKVPYKRQKLDEGDYAAIITKRPDMGIYRDIWFPVRVERKNSVDELANNLGEKTDSRDDIRLIREFQRAKTKGIKMFLVIEDKNGLEKIKKGDYRSQYTPKAFMGKLSSIEDKYLKGTIFVNDNDTGYEIYRKLYYGVRNSLKELDTDIGPEEANVQI